MDDHAARRRAALTGSSDRAEDDRRDGKVKVGMFIHDNCVVAAQLEQAFSETIRESFTNAAADPRRSRE
jgi:hypothetical protein